MNGDIGIGKLIDQERHRDAIHVAVAPLVAAETLYAGNHIGLSPMGEATKSVTPIGIVDPFLTADVGIGQKFYLFMLPGMVTNIRHSWSHSAFQAKVPGKEQGE